MSRSQSQDNYAEIIYKAKMPAMAITTAPSPTTFLTAAPSLLVGGGATVGEVVFPGGTMVPVPSEAVVVRVVTGYVTAMVVSETTVDVISTTGVEVAVVVSGTDTTVVLVT